MTATVSYKDEQYVLNHCTKYLARDNDDERHSFFGTLDGHPRARVSESWRFPIVDSHDGAEPEAYEWNDVMFVYAIARDAEAPVSVELLSTCTTLHTPVPMKRVGATSTCSSKAAETSGVSILPRAIPRIPALGILTMAATS